MRLNFDGCSLANSGQLGIGEVFKDYHGTEGTGTVQIAFPKPAWEDFATKGWDYGSYEEPNTSQSVGSFQPLIEEGSIVKWPRRKEVHGDLTHGSTNIFDSFREVILKVLVSFVGVFPPLVPF